MKFTYVNEVFTKNVTQTAYVSLFLFFLPMIISLKSLKSDKLAELTNVRRFDNITSASVDNFFQESLKIHKTSNISKLLINSFLTHEHLQEEGNSKQTSEQKLESSKLLTKSSAQAKAQVKRKKILVESLHEPIQIKNIKKNDNERVVRTKKFKIISAPSNSVANSTEVANNSNNLTSIKALNLSNNTISSLKIVENEMQIIDSKLYRISQLINHYVSINNKSAHRETTEDMENFRNALEMSTITNVHEKDHKKEKNQNEFTGDTTVSTSFKLFIFSLVFNF